MLSLISGIIELGIAYIPTELEMGKEAIKVLRPQIRV